MIINMKNTGSLKRPNAGAGALTMDMWLNMCEFDASGPLTDDEPGGCDMFSSIITRINKMGCQKSFGQLWTIF